MNPELPRNPQEELEARLTALLLGELSADEAATVRRAIEQDGELAKLFARLHHTIVWSAKPQSNRLSSARNRYAAQVVRGPPPETARAVQDAHSQRIHAGKRRARFTLVEVAAAVAILVVFAGISLQIVQQGREE